MVVRSVGRFGCRIVEGSGGRFAFSAGPTLSMSVGRGEGRRAKCGSPSVAGAATATLVALRATGPRPPDRAHTHLDATGRQRNGFMHDRRLRH